ncbi:MAG: hypothetical protein Q8P74_01925 [bacterium]|nr:hypothetical protein [bacterium]
MAIVFTKQKKSQRNLIIFSVLVILISFLAVWWLLLRKETSYVPTEDAPVVVKKIEINFAVLERMKDFRLFVEIEPLAESTPTSEEPGITSKTIGRENPFLPY